MSKRRAHVQSTLARVVGIGHWFTNASRSMSTNMGPFQNIMSSFNNAPVAYSIHFHLHQPPILPTRYLRYNNLHQNQHLDTNKAPSSSQPTELSTTLFPAYSLVPTPSPTSFACPSASPNVCNALLPLERL
jgi:hypothetical protein